MSKCNGTVACCKNLTHLIKLRVCVWCAKCAKYLAFGTSVVDALKFVIFRVYLRSVYFVEIENFL